MSSKAASRFTSNPQDLERVREILFGKTLREYEQRFQTLQRDVDRLQSALDKAHERLAEQEREHNKRLQEVREELRLAASELRTEMRELADRLTGEKVDKETLGDLFVEFGAQIKGNGLLSSVMEELLQMDQEGA